MSQIKPGWLNDCGWLQDKVAVASGGSGFGEAIASKFACDEAK